MSPATRSRRVTAAALTTPVLLTALTLVGCGGADPAGAPDTAPGTAAPGPTTTGPTATLDGNPVDAAADSLSGELTAALASAVSAFGEVGIDLVQLQAGRVSLYYADPADPAVRVRSELRDSVWSPPVRVPRTEHVRPLPLEEVDPAVVRVATAEAPHALGIETGRLGHVSVSPGPDGRAEYLIAVATDDALGRVTFGPDGQVREIVPPR